MGNIQGAKTDAEKAGILNEHFVNTSDRLQASMSAIDIDETSFFSQVLPPVFEFDDVVLEDVLDAINKLSASKSSSLDGITLFMLKSGKTVNVNVWQTLAIEI